MKSVALCAIAFLLLSFSCSTTDPPSPPPPPPPSYVRTIDLTVVDTGLTDAYLRVKFLDTVQTRAFVLHRNGQPVLTVSAAPSDTILLQDSLGIHQTYSYRAYRLRDTIVIDSSLSVSFTTLDTTSHDFTFQTFEFGEGSSSGFNDVAIISENDIWTVGEVYFRDSTGQVDPIPYNVARWDGVQWHFIRVMFPGVCGGPGTFPTAASAVYTLGPGDIWVVSGAFIARWNGNGFTMLCIPDTLLGGLINKLWGTSPNSVYAVGNSGTIVHWNGTTWQRIESGTTLHVYDIWGDMNPLTGELEVYAVAAEQTVSSAKRVLRVTTQGVTDMPVNRIPSSLHGIWFKAGRRYWVVGAGMYTKTSPTLSSFWQPLHGGVTQNYTYAIRGSGINEIAVSGSTGELLHYNGDNWHSFRSIVGFSLGAYEEVAVNHGIIAAAGYKSQRAIIAIGRRSRSPQ